MHPLQKQILSQLITSLPLPYSKIKPKDVEGNIFIYHLKQLISEGLVRKKEDGKYELTNEGKFYVDKLSLQNFQPRIQPAIINLIACQNSKGEYLLYKRARQPFLGSIGFPYSKIRLGETILQAATHELKEKTGLNAKLIHRGEVYITTFEGKNLISQLLCHIFSAKNPCGKLITNSLMGECFWGKVNDSEDRSYIPGFKAIYKLLKNPEKNLFFAEHTYRL